MGAKPYYLREIQGRTHEDWREAILLAFPLDPVDLALETDDAKRTELLKQYDRLQLALLHLDAMFGMIEATRITYRVAAENATNKVRAALINNKGEALGLEGSAGNVEQFLDQVLRGKAHLPPVGPNPLEVTPEQVSDASRRRSQAQASGFLRDAPGE